MLLRASDAQKRAPLGVSLRYETPPRRNAELRTRSRAKVVKVGLLPDFGLGVSEWSPFVTSAGGRE